MDIQFPQILFQILNFGLVAFVLTKFLYKPIVKILEQRADKVEEGIRAADKSLKTEAELKTQAEAIINQAKKESKQILTEAKKEASALVANITQKARAEAKKALEKEKASLKDTLKRERQTAESELTTFVTQLTQKILADGLSVKDQQAIIASQIKTIKSISLTG